jgi:hypothetical protein
MKILVLATASVAALLAAGSAFAAGPIPLMPIPDGSANTNAVVEQVGDSNNATVTQTLATAATAVVIQGTDTYQANNGIAVVTQGAGSVGEQAVVVQHLNGNNANVNQNGTDQRAGVAQSGNSNAATVVQTGTGSGSPNFWGMGFTSGSEIEPTGVALVTSAPGLAGDPNSVRNYVTSEGFEGVGILQVGNSNSATSNQAGLHNTAVTIQVGDSNTGNITQGVAASDSYAQITTTGTGNIAGISQNNANDTGLIYQNGTFNQAYLTQNSAAAFSTIAQSGNFNVTNVNQ